MKTLTGTGKLVRLILRRDRFILPLWIVLLAIYPVIGASGFKELYPNAAAEKSIAALMNANPGLVAYSGHVFGSSIGSLVAWKYTTTIALIIGLASAFTVIRHTRTEEEAGRRDLIGSAVVGRDAPLAASLVVVFIGNLLLAGLTSAGLISQGLPAAGSVALGLSYAAVGCSFAAIAGVIAQLLETGGGAKGVSLAILGSSFLARAVGDATKEGSALSRLSWLSPIGWAQQVRPFAGEEWWIFALVAGFVLLLSGFAFALSAQRDVGAGVLPPRLGRASASPMLNGPLALAWRLQRRSLIAWTTGMAVFGGVIGGAAYSSAEAIGENAQMKELFLRMGGQASLVDAAVVLFMGAFGLAATGYAIQAALRLRSEEEGQRAEPLLATAVGRMRWVGSHLVFVILGPAIILAGAGLTVGLSYGMSVGDVSRELPRVMEAAMVQLPAVWVLTGLTIALFGIAPRLSSMSWAALSGCLVLMLFGDALRLPQWAMDISPFAHLPKVLGGEVPAVPMIWLVAIGTALTSAGLVGVRQRDIG